MNTRHEISDTAKLRKLEALAILRAEILAEREIAEELDADDDLPAFLRPQAD